MDSLAVASLAHELHNINNTLWWVCLWLFFIAISLPGTGDIVTAIERR